MIENEMRKPGPGMLIEAAGALDLDLEQSWMIGDTLSDMLAGRNAGTRTILVQTGYGARFAHDWATVDHTVPSLAEAVDIILGEGSGSA